MRFLIAILCPPLALILCGKPIQAVLSLILWVAGVLTFGITWIIATIHAWVVIAGREAEARSRKLIKAMQAR
jgi:hypothetical protein